MSRIPDASIIHSRLRLRQLRLMLALEELGSLRRAADEIGMTQPAATKMLHEAGRIPSGARTDDLVFDSLGEEELCVVVGAQNPLSQARKLDWGELQELTWVLQQHPSPMRGIVNQAFHNARIDLPSSIVETTSIMTLLSLLQQTDMIGITPRSVIEDYPGKHLLAILPIQLEPRLPPYGLITRRNRVHSSAMQTFMASVHAEQARHLAK
ncbi:LysR family transcriptional regulator [Pseudomonas aeruginosa]|uniref:LysR family transcriptional regulator n=1 Tax=Pseudomonas aeruginosa TaxID=287 RepID=UPI0010480D57|nr:LysR family transcriptional regulator [Pseudomonas aeruginosa]